MSKVWFITGAGSGIGAATARAALKAGDRVVATGRNLDKVRDALGDVAGGDLAFVQLDVADEAQAKAAVDEALKAFGRIDVLVNNAGYSLLGNFEELRTAEFEGLFATNFYGVAHVMRAVLPVMRKQRSGRIINISSTAGAVGYKHTGAYSATKFAVEGLSLAVAHEVEPFGIRIVVVEPGFFRTDLLDARNARYGGSTIEDYAAEGSAEAMWSGLRRRPAGRSREARRPAGEVRRDGESAAAVPRRQRRRRGGHASARGTPRGTARLRGPVQVDGRFLLTITPNRSV